MRPVRGMREINGQQILTQDLLAKETLLTRKVALEEGDISSGEEQSLASRKS
jgi:hypothetical protein